MVKVILSVLGVFAVLDSIALYCCILIGAQDDRMMEQAQRMREEKKHESDK
ncbi:MAG: hypothetical protein MR378_07970 [Ruminococcus sp.]|uniref:hypothetical protein n=1 Tax=Butyricicoccus porcorum TaxID=1945634 RepID=UPI003F4ABEF5|nr:hypothetical protein [Ruminococcus sp.]